MRVAENLRRIRRELNLTTAELSERLAILGHPIIDTGITKIEKGQRGIDVDDLMALAIALETTPNRLLLPNADPNTRPEPAALTPENTHGMPEGIWTWATGELPSWARKAASRYSEDKVKSDETRFVIANRPHHFSFYREAGTGTDENADDLTTGVELALARGLTTAGVRYHVEMAILHGLTQPLRGVAAIAESQFKRDAASRQNDDE